MTPLAFANNDDAPAQKCWGNIQIHVKNATLNSFKLVPEHRASETEMPRSRSAQVL
jgi:hypothetical protein